jgi:hypothetical protein
MHRDQASVSKRLSNNNLQHRKLAVKRALLAVAAGAACEMMFSPAAHGQTFTWITESGTSNWSTAANWAGVAAPTSGSTTVIDFFDTANTLGPAGGTTVEGDVDAGLNANPFNLNVLNLNGTTTGSGTGTVTIGGANELEFAGTAAQINMNALFGAGSGTTYNITDAINFNAATTITFASTSGGNLNFNNVWSGSGSVTITDNNPNRFVYLNGTAASATYTGNVSVTAGVLSLGDGISNNNSNVLGTNALGTQSVTVSSGASVVINNDDNASTQPQNFILNGAGTGAGGLGTDSALDANNIGFGNNTIGALAIQSASTVRVDYNPTNGNATLGLVVNGVLSGTGTAAFTKTGTGLLMLTKPSYTGPATAETSAFKGNVVVAAGSIETSVTDSMGTNNRTYNSVSNSYSGALGTQSVTVLSGGSVILEGNNAANSQEQVFILNGAGTNNGVQIPGVLGSDAALDADDLNYGDEGVGSIILASNATIRTDQSIGASDPANGSNWGISLPSGSHLAGTGTLTKVGTGSLILNSASVASITAGGNTYKGFTGNVVIDGGTINQWNVANALGANLLSTGGTQTLTVNQGGSFVIDGGWGGGGGNLPQNFILNGTGTGLVQGWEENDGVVTSPVQLPGMSYGDDAALDILNLNYGSNTSIGPAPNGPAEGGSLTIASNATIRLNTASPAVGGQIGVNVYGPFSGSGTMTLVGTNNDEYQNGYYPYQTSIPYTPEAASFLSFQTAGAAFTGNINVTGNSIVETTGASNALGFNYGTGADSTVPGTGTQTVTVSSGAAAVFNPGNNHADNPQIFSINGAGMAYNSLFLGNDAALDAFDVNFGNETIGGLNVASAATVRVNTDMGAAPGLGLVVNGALTGSTTLTLVGSDGDQFEPNSYAGVSTQDAGKLEFSAPGTFTGNIIIANSTADQIFGQGGAILATGHASDALGTNSSGTQSVTVQNGTTMLLDEGNAAFATPQNIILNGTGTPYAGTASITGIAVGSDSALEADSVNYGNASVGGLDIQTSSTIRVNTIASPSAPNWGLQVNGPLAGASGSNLTLVGSTGDAICNGTTTGVTEGYGTLILTQAAAAVNGSGTGDGAFSGNVYVGNGTGNGPVLELAASNALGTNGSGNQTVTVASGSAVVINGSYASPQIFVINGAGTGDVAGNYTPAATPLGGNAALQATGITSANATIGGLNVASNSTVSVSGTAPYGLQVSTGLAGSGNLTVIGGGTLILSSAAAGFSGNVAVNSATLDVSNSSGSATGSGSVTLTGGTLISDSGAISGSVSADSTSVIAPGGIGTVGTLTVGGLTTNSGSTLSFQLGTGPSVVTNGSLLVLGSVGTTISSGTLISITGTPTINHDYRLIGDTSSGSVVNGITLSDFTFSSVPGGDAYALSRSVDSGYIDLVVTASGPVTYTWNDASSNNLWDNSTSSNWNNGSATTTFSAGDAVSFTDTNGSASGRYAVTLNTTVSPGSVAVNNSSGNYSITTTGGGKIVDAGTFTKSGTDTLTIGTALTVTGSTSITGGTLKLAAGVAGGTGPAVTSAIDLTSLSIAPGTALDVNNNHVIITYTSSDPIVTIAGYLKTGYNNGSWNGLGGIDTSAPLTFNGLKYGLGFADSADKGNPAGLSSGTIEVAYTLLGDANLDGTVNGEDFTILASNFNQSVTSWDQGDFNYDGTVNGEDFTLLAANFNQQVSGAASAGDDAALEAFAAANGITLPTSSQPASVPEPATTGLLALGALGILARRRRRST